MPAAIRRLCANRRCGNTTTETYCSACKPNRPADRRPSASRRGYGSRWQKARAAYLAQHPLCVECFRAGKVVAAKHVDHIQPVSQGGAMWDPANWQGLCVPHHNAKTAREDGGFGNPRAVA